MVALSNSLIVRPSPLSSWTDVVILKIVEIALPGHDADRASAVEPRALPAGLTYVAVH